MQKLFNNLCIFCLPFNFAFDSGSKLPWLALNSLCNPGLTLNHSFTSAFHVARIIEVCFTIPSFGLALKRRFKVVKLVPSCGVVYSHGVLTGSASSPWLSDR